MKKLLLSLLLLCGIVVSCDDGRIYEKEIVIPKEGFTLKLTGSLSGMDSWPSKYSLVLASFNANDEEHEYAAKSVAVPTNYNNAGTISFCMDGLKDVGDLELCVINRLRKRVVSFQKIAKDDIVITNDTVYMNVGNLDVDMFKSIQTSIFDAKCISCHGSQGKAPRNLFLTEGKSYSHLVNVQSSSAPEYKLVDPTSASNSLLPIILNEDGILHHAHADILEGRIKSTQITLIKDWIKNGAKE